MSQLKVNRIIHTDEVSPVEIPGGIQIQDGNEGIGKILTSDVDGNASWATAAPTYTDPLTTRGDLLVRDAANVSARLAIGAPGQVLTSDGTDVSWTTPVSSAFATAANVTSNSPGDIAVDDFVFGATSLDAAGTFFSFDRSKGAFRVGTVSGTEWSDVNRGSQSMAWGINTTASATGTTAWGQSTIASGIVSTALGRNSIAAGEASVALGSGFELQAAADGSVGIGLGGNGNNAASTFIMSQANSMSIMGGNVGIGTVAPSATLDVEGTLQYVDGNQSAGKILTSDASGNATWQDNIASIPASTPVVGTAVVPGGVGAQTASFTWGPATDANTIQTSLKYRVCLSEAPITDLDDAIANGEWQSRWSRNMTSIDLYGLFPEKDYYVTVFVKGWDNQEAIYASIMFTTTASILPVLYVSDAADWTITNDQGAPGLDAGDTVTFDAGGAYEKTGLIFGTNAFSSHQAAVAAANLSGLETVIYTNMSEALTAALIPTVDTHIIGAGGGSISRNSGSNGFDLIDCDINLTVANMDFSNRYASGVGDRYILDVRSNMNLTAVNCAFRNGNDSQYQGVAALCFGGTLTAINNSFSNIGRIGIWAFISANSVIKWNDFYGKNGDALQYPIQLSDSTNFLVTENRLHNCTPVAEVDGSPSAAIIAGNSFGQPSDGVVSYNEIIDCTIGFSGFGDNGLMTFTGNTMIGCRTGIINTNTVQAYDLDKNYLGDPNSAEAENYGILNTISKAESTRID